MEHVHPKDVRRGKRAHKAALHEKKKRKIEARIFHFAYHRPVCGGETHDAGKRVHGHRNAVKPECRKESHIIGEHRDAFASGGKLKKVVRPKRQRAQKRHRRGGHGNAPHASRSHVGPKRDYDDRAEQGGVNPGIEHY